jgi:hypothetical protein
MQLYNLKQLEEAKTDLVKKYIGTFDKPLWYYNSLELLNANIEKARTLENKVQMNKTGTRKSIKLQTVIDLIENENSLNQGTKNKMLSDLSHTLTFRSYECSNMNQTIVTLDDCINIMGDDITARQKTWLNQIFAFTLR